MNNKILLYLVGTMILYDLAIHLVYLFKIEDFFLKRKINFWPNFGKGKQFKRDKYQLFWTVYWLVAFVLVLLLIFTK